MDDAKNQIVQGRYRLLRCVGEGSQGRVYLSEDLGRGGEQVAVKLVDAMVGGPRDSSADMILRWFRHPNWAPILDGGPWGDNGWFQVSRFIRGSNLESLTGPQPESWVWAFLECGARVLGALHRHNVIHYDITPGNWMVEERGGDPTFILTDGGLAHEGPIRGLARGTPRFMAPEVTQDVEHDHRVDFYSLGLVAYRLATGRDPFEGGAGEVLGQRRRSEAPRARVFRPDLSAALDDVIHALIDRNPRSRPASRAELLDELSRQGSRPAPRYTRDEIASISEGGPIEGREEPLSRFRHVVEALAKRTERHEPFVPRDVPRIPDGVLLVRGLRGAGSTRLCQQMESEARAAGVPTAKVSAVGRRISATELLSSLWRAVGTHQTETRPATALAARDPAREVERLLRGLTRSPTPRPRVVFLEQYRNFDADARRVVRTVSRFLLARHEAARGSGSLPVVLIVDVGNEPVADLLLPDSSARERPILQLGAMKPEDIRRLCTSRLPGLELSSGDWDFIHSVCSGLPGRVVGVLGQALVNGDLRPAAGGWAWSVEHATKYVLDAPVTPNELLWLSRSDRQTLSALATLAVPDCAIPARLAEASLPPRSKGTPFEHLTALDENGTRLRSDTVRALIGQKFPDLVADGAERILRTGMALDTWSGNELSVLVSAAVRLERWDDASTLLGQLVKARDISTVQTASHAIGILRGSGDRIDANLTRRAASLLRRHYAPDLARELAGTPARQFLDTKSALCVAASLERSGDATSALDILRTCTTDAPLEVLVAAGRCQLQLHLTKDARITLAKAREKRRQGASMDVLGPYSVLLAQYAYLSQRYERCNRLLILARSLARRASLPGVSADAFNGLGILAQAKGDLRAAEQHFRRASKLRLALGDVAQVLRIHFNLARTLQLRGKLAPCAAMLQQTTALAIRHANHSSASQCLRALSRVYDQQMNVRLATLTLARADREARSNNSLFRIASVSWELAPLAAAKGDYEAASRALRTSAQAARQRVTPYARASHNLTSALVNLHLGDRRRALLAARRALARRGAFFEAELAQLQVVAALLAETHRPAPRATVGHPTRSLHRLRLLAMRVSTACPRYRSTSTWARLVHQSSLPGTTRRLVFECIMRSADFSQHNDEQQYRSLARRLDHSGEVLLRARLLAARSARSSLKSPDTSLSRAVEALAGCSLPEWFAPDEFVAADTRTRETLELPPRSGRPDVETLHALAHRSLIRSGPGPRVSGDERVSTALRNVLDASAQLKASGDIGQLLNTITRRALDITKAERVSIVRVVDGEAQHATTAVASTRHTPPARPVSDAVISRVLSGLRPLLLHDVFDDEELMQRPSITGLSLRSIMCVPLVRGDSVYGVMYADDASAAASFDQIDLEILSLFAEQVSATLETKRLLDDLHQSMAELKDAQQRLIRGERLRAIGEVSSGVAHEFNNILTGILARVQLAKLSSLPASVESDLDLIERASLDAAEIVRTLQRFSKSERQRDFRTLDLAALTKEATEFLAPLWMRGGDSQDKKTTVRVITHEPVRVKGNPTELREVVTNLLKNALDAAPGGAVELEVRGGAEATLLVRDSGAGIPAETMRRIFDPFFTTKQEGGTGLGLALCQQIVERHGGALTVSSDPGVGTEFRATFPVSATARPPQVQSEDVALPHSLRVLVVDDDENVRFPLSDYLDRAGHAVESAADGSEGLAIAPRLQPHVAIADVCMPNVDGIEFCRRVREVSPKTVVILMSGRAGSMDSTSAQRAGAQTLIPKPFAMQTMVQLLRQVCPEADAD